MLLGKKAYFTKQHYEAQKGNAPPHLCELVVHCLELVSQLAAADLEFRFKGGNSLLILLENPQRFSIDVDIVTTVSKDSLTETVTRIGENCDVFSKTEIRPHKTKPWLPMISYKLFFDSVYQNPEDAFVMLDAVLEPPPYGGVRKQVRCLDIYSAEQDVEVPSISGLMADKFLTLGPATLGIPIGKHKEAQRLKHVFDVSLLATHPHDKDVIREAIAACMEQENRIQRSRHTLQEVIEDTRSFLGQPLLFSEQPDLKLAKDNPYLKEIVVGFEQFRSHLFRTAYSWEMLCADCRRVLDLADALEQEKGG